jgi:FkbM family methyltransferase
MRLVARLVSGLSRLATSAVRRSLQLGCKEQLMLTTRQKIAMARVLNFGIMTTLSAIGRSSIVQVRRSGVLWELDLNEGIDLAIFLGVYQKIPNSVLDAYIKPGALVIDIGANIGSHTLQLAKRVGESGCVIAVEPTDHAFAKLLANIGLNPDLARRIIPVQTALGQNIDAYKKPEYYSRWPLCADVGKRHKVHLGVLEAATSAQRLSLDELVRKHAAGRPVSFIKLDVDGNEFDVLRSGYETLHDQRPPILIEVAPHIQDEVVGRFEAFVVSLSQHGYKLEDQKRGRPLPLSAEALRALIAHGASKDVMARP